MLLFEILGLHTDKINPGNSKVHVATDPGNTDPLDAFFAGRFEAWQTRQSKRNFPRRYIVSLIKLPGKHRWLFGGCFEKLGCSPVGEPRRYWRYLTKEVTQTAALTGRLIVQHRRSGQASYRNAETVASELEVSELLERRMTIGDFPGYSWVSLTKPRLDVIVREELRSWKAALSAVAGVYLITDTHGGKHYVGSATGIDGLWSRWSAYSKNGHGGNKELRRLLREQGADYANHFRYSVLETADTRASDEDVLRREGYWKVVLSSREHGLNDN